MRVYVRNLKTNEGYTWENAYIKGTGVYQGCNVVVVVTTDHIEIYNTEKWQVMTEV